MRFYFFFADGPTRRNNPTRGAKQCSVVLSRITPGKDHAAKPAATPETNTWDSGPDSKDHQPNSVVQSAQERAILSPKRGKSYGWTGKKKKATIANRRQCASSRKPEASGEVDAQPKADAKCPVLPRADIEESKAENSQEDSAENTKTDKEGPETSLSLHDVKTSPRAGPVCSSVLVSSSIPVSSSVPATDENKTIPSTEESSETKVKVDPSPTKQDEHPHEPPQPPLAVSNKMKQIANSIGKIQIPMKMTFKQPDGSALNVELTRDSHKELLNSTQLAICLTLLQNAQSFSLAYGALRIKRESSLHTHDSVDVWGVISSLETLKKFTVSFVTEDVSTEMIKQERHVDGDPLAEIVSEERNIKEILRAIEPIEEFMTDFPLGRSSIAFKKDKLELQAAGPSTQSLGESSSSNVPAQSTVKPEENQSQPSSKDTVAVRVQNACDIGAVEQPDGGTVNVDRTRDSHPPAVLQKRVEKDIGSDGSVGEKNVGQVLGNVPAPNRDDPLPSPSETTTRSKDNSVGDSGDICEPKTVICESETDIGEPKTDIGEPKTDIGEPKTDICAPKTDIGAPKTDICTPKTDIGAPKTDICTPKTDMGAPKLDICAPKTDICAPKLDICAPKLDICAPKTDICAPKTDIGAPKTDIGAPKTDMHVTEVTDNCATSKKSVREVKHTYNTRHFGSPTVNSTIEHWEYENRRTSRRSSVKTDESVKESPVLIEHKDSGCAPSESDISTSLAKKVKTLPKKRPPLKRSLRSGESQKNAAPSQVLTEEEDSMQKETTATLSTTNVEITSEHAPKIDKEGESSDVPTDISTCLQKVAKTTLPKKRPPVKKACVSSPRELNLATEHTGAPVEQPIPADDVIEKSRRFTRNNTHMEQAKPQEEATIEHTEIADVKEECPVTPESEQPREDTKATGRKRKPSWLQTRRPAKKKARLKVVIPRLQPGCDSKSSSPAIETPGGEEQSPVVVRQANSVKYLGNETIQIEFMDSVLTAKAQPDQICDRPVEGTATTTKQLERRSSSSKKDVESSETTDKTGKEDSASKDVDCDTTTRDTPNNILAEPVKGKCRLKAKCWVFAEPLEYGILKKRPKFFRHLLKTKTCNIHELYGKKSKSNSKQRSEEKSLCESSSLMADKTFPAETGNHKPDKGTGAREPAAPPVMPEVGSERNLKNSGVPSTSSKQCNDTNKKSSSREGSAQLQKICESDTLMPANPIPAETDNHKPDKATGASEPAAPPVMPEVSSEGNIKHSNVPSTSSKKCNDNKNKSKCREGSLQLQKICESNTLIPDNPIPAETGNKKTDKATGASEPAVPVVPEVSSERNVKHPDLPSTGSKKRKKEKSKCRESSSKLQKTVSPHSAKGNKGIRAAGHTADSPSKVLQRKEEKTELKEKKKEREQSQKVILTPKDQPEEFTKEFNLNSYLFTNTQKHSSHTKAKKAKTKTRTDSEAGPFKSHSMLKCSTPVRKNTVGNKEKTAEKVPTLFPEPKKNGSEENLGKGRIEQEEHGKTDGSNHEEILKGDTSDGVDCLTNETMDQEVFKEGHSNSSRDFYEEMFTLNKESLETVMDQNSPPREGKFPPLRRPSVEKPPEAVSMETEKLVPPELSQSEPLDSDEEASGEASLEDGEILDDDLDHEINDLNHEINDQDHKINDQDHEIVNECKELPQTCRIHNSSDGDIEEDDDVVIVRHTVEKKRRHSPPKDHQDRKKKKTSHKRKVDAFAPLHKRLERAMSMKIMLASSGSESGLSDTPPGFQRNEIKIGDKSYPIKKKEDGDVTASPSKTQDCPERPPTKEQGGGDNTPVRSSPQDVGFSAEASPLLSPLPDEATPKRSSELSPQVPCK